MKREDELFVLKEGDGSSTEHIDAPKYSYWRSVFRTFFKKKSNYVVLGILGIIVLLSIIQPMFSGYDPVDSPNINILETHNLGPSWANPFGTDSTGSSMWDVVWAGARTSLALAIICSAINVFIGILVGSIWGYSKRIDKVMMEIYNIIANVPFILVIMIIVYIVGAGFWQLVFAMCLTGWLGIAFFIRTQIIIIRDREHNLASRCLGTPMRRMITKNMLPYLTSVIVTIIAQEVPSYISYEVFLSYLGIGLTSSTPSLGGTINNYVSYMSSINQKYLFWIPVAVSAIISITLYVVGQNLADASDPRTHM